MANNLDEYKDALKYAFSKIWASKPNDWSASAESVNKIGQTVCDFKNEQLGLFLCVTDEGDDAKAGGRKFSVKDFKDKRMDMNMTIPPNFKR